MKLSVIRLEQSQLQIDRLNPLDVREKTADGVFERARVVEEVEDWARRISALYSNIGEWLNDQPGLRCEESRAVTMSEQMMQKFAVPDRELPILDVLSGDQVIISFVPRGLWLNDAWGRIDVITSDHTQILVAIRREGGKFEWRLASSNGRGHTAFDRNALVGARSPPMSRLTETKRAYDMAVRVFGAPGSN